MGAAREATTDRAGLILGRFRPLRPLGSGGSGSVWLARDEQEGREVALKVVRREGKAAARAEREVDAAARLRHPRCLRTLALERDEGHVYVAYEYVRGRTLRDALTGGTLDDQDGVEACAQILEGLAHAHSKRIVHRDVKPANVMLDEGDEISVRLLDFGLAHLEEAETLTAVGDVPGTLAYVSPERLAGQPTTAAADVWSTGVVLWEALAGWHPFSAASPIETAKRIREGARPLAELRPDLPADLCAIVDRMLALDPRRRPAAKQLPGALRHAFAETRRRPRPAASLSSLRERALHAAFAAAFTAAALLVLPFFPRGWPFLLGALAGVAALRSPRVGLALALAAPILPLGNIALGLAIAYGLLAAGWFALFARQPTNGLLFLSVPALVPLGSLGFIPLAVQRVDDQIRRAATVAVGALAAGAFAALAGGAFPLGPRPQDIALAETARPDAAASAVAGSLGACPAIFIVSAVLVAESLTLPRARRSGLWGLAFWGSGFTAAVVLGPLAVGTTVSAPVLVPGIWAAVAWLAAPALRRAETPGTVTRSADPFPAPGL
jgi:Ser/Thr protein kinase RdoA (MazF antagonist)